MNFLLKNEADARVILRKTFFASPHSILLGLSVLHEAVLDTEAVESLEYNQFLDPEDHL